MFPICRSLPGYIVCFLLFAAAISGVIGCASPGYRFGNSGSSADRRNVEDSIYSNRADYTWDNGNKVIGAGFTERDDDSWPEEEPGEAASSYRVHGNNKAPDTKTGYARNAGDPGDGGKRACSPRNTDVRRKDRDAAPGGGSRYSNNVTYRVHKGDSLYKISRRFDCSVNELARLNKISSSGGIRAGMVLRIPSCRKTGCGKGSREIQRGYGTELEFTWPLKRVLHVERDTGPGMRTGGVMIKGARGDSVLSAADGAVEKIGEMRGYGTYVILSHEGRYVSVYARLKDIRVREGDKVASGSSIARISSEDGTIIFEIGRSGKPVDPLRFLPKKNGLALSTN
jgi:hypothetical protein